MSSDAVVSADMPTSALDWRQIFQAVPEGLIVIGLNFDVIFVNRAFAALSGVDAMQAIGRKCYDIFPGSICHGRACPMVRILAGVERLMYEADKHCMCGRLIPSFVTAVPYRLADGALAGIVETITDASTAKVAREELHRSHERLRRAMGAIIQAMSAMIEKRDTYTAGHQRRVAKLCRALAMELGFSWERTHGLRMAAAVHDLGKIEVASEILTKSGQLSEYELAIIHLHPETAYDILKGIEFSWPLAETVYQHHERLDGSGYPRRLKGDQILVEARILAVADVVEAITSFRPYRPGLGFDAALEELAGHSGSLYDANVIAACEVLFRQRGFDFDSKCWMRR
jgi:PAS domain S-box-containing protein